ncbi:hypothetical protein TKK_0004654 [Trichogramma kaykai]
MMCIAAYKNILNANYFEKGTVDIGRKNFDVIQDFVVLKREIEKCFNYNPVMRPKAKEILMVLKNSGIEVEID